MTLVFQNPSALWIGITALLFVGGEIWFRRTSKKYWVGIPRVLWIGLVTFLLMDMALTKEERLSDPLPLSVVVDRSDSIWSIGERRARVDTFLEELKQWSEKTKRTVNLYSFADSRRDEGGFKIDGGGLSTSLGAALQGLEGESGGLVLLSDGNFQDRATAPRAILSLNLGESSEKDVWFESVPQVATAFLKNRIKIPIVIGQKGLKGKSITLEHFRGSDLLESKEVVLDADRVTVDLSHFPERMGEAFHFLRITGVNGELSALNNLIGFRVRTVRDKIRVLHIGGRPSVDLKTWRYFLTRQPDVDLVSFYILRSMEDDPQARPSELSLIPFPYEELFSTELPKFDLVILQNFDFTLYFQSFYLANLAQFVRGGGALLMIGGDQSLHRYQGSPLEDLFPFRYFGLGVFELGNDRVSKVLNHPIMEGSEKTLRARDWNARHRISPRSGSLDLVTLNSGIPLVSGRDADKGRVLMVNSDEFWKLQAQPGSDSSAFSRLLRKFLQYLTFDPEVEPQKILSGAWHVGRQVRLKLAQPDLQADWILRSVRNPTEIQQFKNVSEVNFTIPEAGWYQVEVSALDEAAYFETEERPWLNEWKDLIASPMNLKLLSSESRGEFFEFTQRDKIWDQQLSGQQVLASTVSPWTREGGYLSWLILFSSLFLLGLDFYLRKRSQWDL